MSYIFTLRSRVERLPPSPHVKEPSVTAHYAHDEWSIRDLLHWQNYLSLPITFPCFESRGVWCLLGIYHLLLVR
jgi:hypothetical protein